MRNHVDLSSRVYRWAFAAILLFAIAVPVSQAETFEVTLEGLDFVYDGQTNMDIDLTIDPGDTVRWVWVSGFHNVASGFPGEPGEGDLFYSGPPTSAPGTLFEYTFMDPGYYGYHCEVHETLGMISAVTVLPEPGTALLSLAGLALFLRRR